MSIVYCITMEKVDDFLYSLRTRSKPNGNTLFPKNVSKV